MFIEKNNNIHFSNNFRMNCNNLFFCDLCVVSISKQLVTNQEISKYFINIVPSQNYF